jgi:hypothetical protein
MTLPSRHASRMADARTPWRLDDAIASKILFRDCHGRLPVFVTAFACDRTHTAAPPPVAAGAAPARPGAHDVACALPLIRLLW